MRNRDLIKLLLDEPMDSEVHIGKGTGSVEKVETAVTDRIYVILSPEK